jgi:hypothetical protein
LVRCRELLAALIEDLGEGGGFGGFLLEPCPLMGVGTIGRLFVPEGGGVAMLLGNLGRAGEFVGNVPRGPGLLAFVGADTHAELPVAHLELVAVGFRAPESAPSRAPRGVFLDLPGLRGRPDRGVRVLVAGELTVCGDCCRAPMPVVEFFLFPGWAAESFDGPLGLLGDDLVAELGAARIGGLGEAA